MNFSQWIICSKKLVYLSLLNITPQKIDGRNCVLKFFHSDWRRCTMSYPRMVKTINLGMFFKSPLNQHTLGLHTSNFCFSINALYRVNLERLLFVFVLPHTLCLTTTWWGWGHKAIYLFAGNLEKAKKIKPTLLIPREFDIKPSSHPRGEKLPLLHTLHLEAQPNPYSFQGIKSDWHSWGRGERTEDT